MTHQKLIISLLLFLCSQNLFSQQRNRVNVVERLKEADTVLILSHKDVEGSTNEFVDSTGTPISLPFLFIDNRLNEAVVIKKEIVKEINLKLLRTILSRPYTAKVIKQAGCFKSHHAIVLIKNQRASFIDLCFECNHFETSSDLNNISAFDKIKWDKLRALFKKMGFAIEEEI